MGYKTRQVEHVGTSSLTSLPRCDLGSRRKISQGYESASRVGDQVGWEQPKNHPPKKTGGKQRAWGCLVFEDPKLLPENWYSTVFCCLCSSHGFLLDELSYL